MYAAVSAGANYFAGSYTVNRRLIRLEHVLPEWRNKIGQMDKAAFSKPNNPFQMPSIYEEKQIK